MISLNRFSVLFGLLFSVSTSAFIHSQSDAVENGNVNNLNTLRINNSATSNPLEDEPIDSQDSVVNISIEDKLTGSMTEGDLNSAGFETNQDRYPVCHRHETSGRFCEVCNSPRRGGTVRCIQCDRILKSNKSCPNKRPYSQCYRRQTGQCMPCKWVSTKRTIPCDKCTRILTSPNKCPNTSLGSEEKTVYTEIKSSSDAVNADPFETTQHRFAVCSRLGTTRSLCSICHPRPGDPRTVQCRECRHIVPRGRCSRSESKESEEVVENELLESEQLFLGGTELPWPLLPNRGVCSPRNIRNAFIKSKQVCRQSVESDQCKSAQRLALSLENSCKNDFDKLKSIVNGTDPCTNFTACNQKTVECETLIISEQRRRARCQALGLLKYDIRFSEPESAFDATRQCRECRRIAPRGQYPFSRESEEAEIQSNFTKIEIENERSKILSFNNSIVLIRACDNVDSEDSSIFHLTDPKLLNFTSAKGKIDSLWEISQYGCPFRVDCRVCSERRNRRCRRCRTSKMRRRCCPRRPSHVTCRRRRFRYCVACSRFRSNSTSEHDSQLSESDEAQLNAKSAFEEETISDHQSKQGFETSQRRRFNICRRASRSPNRCLPCSGRRQSFPTVSCNQCARVLRPRQFCPPGRPTSGPPLESEEQVNDGNELFDSHHY